MRGIVDKAVKEMAMEKVLCELDSTWSGGYFIVIVVVVVVFDNETTVS